MISKVPASAVPTNESNRGNTSTCDVEADTGTTTTARRSDEFTAELGELGWRS